MSCFNRNKTLKLIKDSRDTKSLIEISIAIYNGFEKKRLDMNGKQARALRKIAEANTDGDKLRTDKATKILKESFKQFKRSDGVRRGNTK